MLNWRNTSLSSSMIKRTEAYSPSLHGHLSIHSLGSTNPLDIIWGQWKILLPKNGHSSISDPTCSSRTLPHSTKSRVYLSSPWGSDGKASACNAGDLGSILMSGRSPGEGNGNPLQYSCLENPMDGRAWQATVHGVTKSLTRLSMETHILSLNQSVHVTALTNRIQRKEYYMRQKDTTSSGAFCLRGWHWGNQPRCHEEAQTSLPGETTWRDLHGELRLPQPTANISGGM